MMKIINSFRDTLILFSIMILLKFAPGANALPRYDPNENTDQLVNGMMVFPDDSYTPEPQTNSLLIYQSESMIKPKEDNRSVALLASRLNDFHTRLTSAILRGNPRKNVIYSPISVSMLLSMMAFGARSNTSDQILNGLGLKLDYRTYTGYHQLGQILKSSDGVVLNFVNQIFTGVNLEGLFKNATRVIYRTNITEVNFSDINNAAAEINEWCKKSTNNHIRKIINADDLEGVLMVLANAIYFEGSWQIPFKPQATRTENFYINNYERVPVQMMTISDSFNAGHIDELNAHYIELPYKHEDDKDDYFSMYLLVPMAVDELELIARNLHLIDFKRLNRVSVDVDLWLPKFKIEDTLDLIPVLKKMGIEDMFTDKADFSGMTNLKLHASKMIQKAYLEINERGSKAAAITAAGFGWRSPISLEIRADKPFLSAIVIKSLGIPLFFAKIADPTQFL